MWLDDLFPQTPMSSKDPVLLLWISRNKKMQERQPNLQSGRARAIKLIGIDDRITVTIYHAATKKKLGVVGCYARVPYWAKKNVIKSLNPDGTLQDDLYF